MLVFYFPLSFVAASLNFIVQNEMLFSIAFGLSNLMADLAIFFILKLCLNENSNNNIYFYWLSPLVVYISYWLGHLDLVPIALLTASFVMIKYFKPLLAGVFIGLALSSKLSMVLAVPFVFIYFYVNRRLNKFLPSFCFGLVFTFSVFQGLVFLSEGFRVMFFENPQIEKFYLLTANLGLGLKVYLTPLVFLLLLYGIWRLKRINFEMLLSATGISFFVAVLMTPAQVSWYLWAIPFFIVIYRSGDLAGILSYWAFSFLVVSFHVIYSPGVEVPLFGLDLNGLDMISSHFISPHVQSLWITLITASGLVLVLRMFREGIKNNDYFFLNRAPLVIGISGDSGSGKDTLSCSLAKIFGEHSVVHLTGDDYHIWDRKAPMWSALTHLNPHANNLFELITDLNDLIRRKSVVCRQYDHQTGQFTKPELRKPNDIIIASGLHILYPTGMREKLDVGIFLDIDEDLRCYWKIKRDTLERKHTIDKVLTSMEKRQPDAEKYVHPQAYRADIVFTLSPANKNHLADDFSFGDFPLRLKVLLRRGYFYGRLQKIFLGISGFYLDAKFIGDTGELYLLAEGNIVGKDIELAAYSLVPHLEELLDLSPKWEDGMLGLMQLITLLQIDESLRHRI